MCRFHVVRYFCGCERKQLARCQKQRTWEASGGSSTPCSVRQVVDERKPVDIWPLMCQPLAAEESPTGKYFMGHERIWYITQKRIWEDFWENEIFPALKNRPEVLINAQWRRQQETQWWTDRWKEMRGSVGRTMPPYRVFEEFVKHLMDRMRVVFQIYGP